MLMYGVNEYNVQDSMQASFKKIISPTMMCLAEKKKEKKKKLYTLVTPKDPGRRRRQVNDGASSEHSNWLHWVLHEEWL